MVSFSCGDLPVDAVCGYLPGIDITFGYEVLAFHIAGGRHAGKHCLEASQIKLPIPRFT